MSTIQYIDKEHRELLEDLREIARSYQPLRETDPQKYRRTVLREMNDYLHRIKRHPVFSEFCELTHINQDEFINDILQQIKKNCSNKCFVNSLINPPPYPIPLPVTERDGSFWRYGV